MKKQQYVDPYLVDANETRRLARISNIDKKLNEQWVQKLLFENPSLLPTIEIEPAFSPVISIARELPTKAGSIDLLFISPLGYIILVETKLFRNPEARREVVAQTLDYAKELSQWSYDDLMAAVKKSRIHAGGDNPDVIYSAVTESQGDNELEPSQFQKSVSQGLRYGRFLLLIVGDYIREDVEWLVEYLENYAHLQFKMALVELGLYRMEESQEYPMVVVPRIVARTNEIVRAIVRIEGDENLKKLPVVTAPGRVKETTPSRESFLEAARGMVDAGSIEKLEGFLNDLEELGIYVDPLNTGVALRFADPGGGNKDFRLFRVTKEGRVWIGDILKKQLDREGYDWKIAIRYAETIALWVGGKVDPNTGIIIVKDRDRMFPIKILSEMHKEEYLNLVREVLEQIRANADQKG